MQQTKVVGLSTPIVEGKDFEALGRAFSYQEQLEDETGRLPAKFDSCKNWIARRGDTKLYILPPGSNGASEFWWVAVVSEGQTITMKSTGRYLLKNLKFILNQNKVSQSTCLRDF